MIKNLKRELNITGDAPIYTFIVFMTIFTIMSIKGLISIM